MTTIDKQFLNEDNIQMIWEIVQTHENIEDLKNFGTPSEKIYSYLLSDINLYISSNIDIKSTLLQLNKNFITYFISNVIQNIQHFKYTPSTSSDTESTTDIFSNLKQKIQESKLPVYETYEPSNSNNITYTEITNTNTNINDISKEVTILKQHINDLLKRVSLLEESRT